MNEFLNLLFDPEDDTCFTERPHGSRVQYEPDPKDLYFCINALHPTMDLSPTKQWHAANKPRRADCNVVKYRNFLLELDSLPLEQQVELVRSRIPFSTCVYSGGKSHHFIVSLEEPLTSTEEYAQFARRLHKLVPEADPTTKNPSRLSRLPFRLRPDTGKDQILVSLGSRIPRAQLEALLPQLPPPIKRTKKEVKALVTPVILQASYQPDTVMRDFNIGGRNAFFWWLFNRFNDVDMDSANRMKFVESAYNNLADKSGFSFEEALIAARLKE